MTKYSVLCSNHHIHFQVLTFSYWSMHVLAGLTYKSNQISFQTLNYFGYSNYWLIISSIVRNFSPFIIKMKNTAFKKLNLISVRTSSGFLMGLGHSLTARTRVCCLWIFKLQSQYFIYLHHS